MIIDYTFGISSFFIFFEVWHLTFSQMPLSFIKRRRMKNKRLCKEYKLNVSNNCCVKFGSMNRLNPKVIYIEGKMYVWPTCEFDYEEGMKRILSNMKKRLISNLSKCSAFSDNIVFDYDVASYRMNIGTSKLLFFTCYMRQKGEVKTLKEIGGIIEEPIANAVGKLEFDLEEGNFKVSKTRKTK